jgi:hypothetical protein
VGGRGSGGSNAIPIEVHRLRGTLGGNRHVAPTTRHPLCSQAPPDGRILAELDREARRVAARVLDEYGPRDDRSPDELAGGADMLPLRRRGSNLRPFRRPQ